MTSRPKTLVEFINEFDVTPRLPNVQRVNDKIYKHYSIVKPQGCALSPSVEKQEVDRLVRRNFMQQRPHDLDNQSLNDLNYTYHQNQSWLSHRSQDNASFAQQQLNTFRKNKPTQLASMIEFMKDKYRKKECLQRIINRPHLDIALDKVNDLSLRLTEQQRKHLQIKVKRMKHLEETHELIQRQPTQPKIQNATSPRSQPSSSKQLSPVQTKVLGTQRIMEDCVGYTATIKEQQKQLQVIRTRLERKVKYFIRRLSPLPPDSSSSYKQTMQIFSQQERLHDYLVLQTNEAQTQQLRGDIMQQYEIKLFNPCLYNKLLLTQRKKQYRKDSQNIKIHRFVEDKKLGRVLKVDDFMGFE